VSLVIGVVGGGQLARMMIPAAEALGIELRVLAETEGSSAKRAATAVGDYRDWDTLRAFAEGVDVLTFDHEHVPTELLHTLEASGTAVRPGPDALVFAQDKTMMRERLAELDVPLPRWSVATTAQDVTDFLTAEGGEAIAKTPRGGYDGKGVAVISSADDISGWLAQGPVLLEEKVQFSRELAQLIARRPGGGTREFPLVHTIQEGGVCAEVIAPAPGADDALRAEAARIAHTIADAIGVTGILAVELFETTDGRLVVNELAMRPHNSGHVFTDGAVTSQFEQHLRAVADWPLGDVSLRHEWAVMVNLFGDAGNERIYAALEHAPEVKAHAYGKEPRPGRKAGHLVVCGTDLEHVHQVARAAARAGEGEAV
jgi:5-(carboxyamino)imidazole ribonucleotide synthase